MINNIEKCVEKYMEIFELYFGDRFGKLFFSFDQLQELSIGCLIGFHPQSVPGGLCPLDPPSGSLGGLVAVGPWDLK